MKKILLGLMVIGFASQAFAQDPEPIELSEVIVKPVNYKYLNQVDSRLAAVPVKMLERKVASYDVTEQDFYQDDYDYYTVSFFIPEGKIVAVYDQEGNIMRTIEKFKDIKLPTAVMESLADRFPNWKVVSDVYRVKYNDNKGAKQSYKLKLENGDKTMRVKIDENGEFM
ncbi:MAG: nicotinate-nucleotide adenylyltransferase [Eudoraea sp.]|nr:nicotinate-nucleotide adenylyltransferase [Eudoraea sp.]